MAPKYLRISTRTLDDLRAFASVLQQYLPTWRPPDVPSDLLIHLP